MLQRNMHAKVTERLHEFFGVNAAFKKEAKACCEKMSPSHLRVKYETRRGVSHIKQKHNLQSSGPTATYLHSSSRDSSPQASGLSHSLVDSEQTPRSPTARPSHFLPFLMFSVKAK